MAIGLADPRHPRRCISPLLLCRSAAGVFDGGCITAFPWIDISADILALAGMVFALWARITLGRNWNLYQSLKENQGLIVRGPYQLVRHPMYAGFVSMFHGVVIW
jgi:protein-S-isoprenylcysteine O-methyltransferase Ste14